MSKITIDELSPDLIERLSNSGDSAELAAAGKKMFAESFGEPLQPTNTFQEMCDDIDSMLESFRTAVFNNGITVDENDKFKELVEKSAIMTADNEQRLRGIRLANDLLNLL